MGHRWLEGSKTEPEEEKILDATAHSLVIAGQKMDYEDRGS